MFPKSTDMYGNVERRDICRQDILRVSRFQRMATEIMTFQENKIEKVGNLRLRQKYEFTIKKKTYGNSKEFEHLQDGYSRASAI